jgi:hypothetical protein
MDGRSRLGPARPSIRKNASPSMLKRLAKALGVPVTALLS